MSTTEVTLAAYLLGDEVDADVVEFLVEEGSLVQAGDAVLRLESAKIELEISAPVGGRIHFLVEVGAVADVEQVLAVIEE